jgi:hypothetical protein
VDSVHCPACGAAVRAKESWCSLCYQDLRPQEPLVATSKSGLPAIASNLIEVDSTAPRAINIAGIPRPSSPSAQESLDFGDGFPVGDAELDRDDVEKAWPCSCGNAVAFDIDTCPECGNGFLAELRVADAPHHSGPAWMSSYLEASRTIRLAIAAAFALTVAIGIPGLLALFS